MKKILFIWLTIIALVLLSCDDKEEEEDAGPDGGCSEECDDTDWD